MIGSSIALLLRASAPRAAKPLLFAAIAAAALSACATVKPEVGAEGDPLSYDWVMEHGSPDQQEELCVRYVRGDIGVERDYAKAYNLCCKSMESCYGQAAETLYILYQHGWGVEKDYVKALGWNYMVSTDTFYFEVMRDRALFEAYLTEYERNQAKKFACDWEKKYCGIVTLPWCER